jgi:hypothetical protein
MASIKFFAQLRKIWDASELRPGNQG